MFFPFPFCVIPIRASTRIQQSLCQKQASVVSVDVHQWVELLGWSCRISSPIRIRQKGQKGKGTICNGSIPLQCAKDAKKDKKKDQPVAAPWVAKHRHSTWLLVEFEQT